MFHRHTMGLFVCCGVSAAGQAAAAPILLASASNTITRYADDVVTAWGMNDPLRYGLPSGAGPWLFEDMGLTVSLGAPAVTIEQRIGRGDDAEFDAFVTLLTDGLPGGGADDAFEDLLILGRLGSESDVLDYHVPRVAVDLSGYEVEFILRRLTFSMESPGRDLNGDGQWTDFHVSGVYEIWGSPVPEPATGLLLLIGLAVCLKRGQS